MSKSTKTSMASTNIFSLNIRGLNDEKKRRIIFKWLENNKCNILFAQETFCTKEFPRQNNSKWTVKHNLTNSAHSRGVAIMFHNSLNIDIQNIHKKDDARAILINLKIENVETTLCNIYAPTEASKREEFFNTMRNWILRHADYPDYIILGGDFNCAINDNDRKNIRGNIDSSRPVLKKVLKDLKLIDSWYIHNKNTQYTFTDPETGSKSRLDYIFVSEQVKHKIKNIKVKHAPQKDRHKAVCLNIILQNNKKGPGHWKLNSKLLEMKEHETLMDHVVLDIDSNYNELNWTLKWELLKIKTQEGSIRLGVMRAKKQKEYVNGLQKNNR